jgi:predicted Zn-dependent protease
MIRKFILTTTLMVTVILTAPPGVLASVEDDIPDMGSLADTVISKNKATQIGRGVLMQLRQQDQIIEDPETDEYISSLGHILSAQAHEGDQRFKFFVVNENTINAFALPGGYIGVNSGLVLETDSESELAGVMSHEIAHVTQNHIARRVAAQGRSSLLSMAAVVAAIAMGATGNASGEAVQATIMGAQGLAVQSSINYTRENEYEADRVGIQILSSAGYDPMGMPDFFETMGRISGRMANRVPEFLLTHPVSSTRIAETRARAETLPPPVNIETIDYRLARARLRVLSAQTPNHAVRYFTSRLQKASEPYPYLRYGLALALMRDGDPEQAVQILHELMVEDESVIAFHSAYGQALMAAHQPNESILTFEHALLLFPRNVPLTVRYGEALMAAGQYDRAHEILLDLFNNTPPTPSQVKLIAKAAGAAGENAEAHYYMCEYYLLNGNVELAVGQLNLALQQPNLQDVQRARFEARRAQLVPYLSKKQQEASRG